MVIGAGTRRPGINRHIAPAGLPPHIVGMSKDVSPGHEPERPRVEPEIIPPGTNYRPRDQNNVFMQFEGFGGAHRIFIARPGWPAIIAALLIFGLFAALVFIVLAGIVVLWIPIVILGILAAIVPATARIYWGRIKGFLSGRR